MGMKKIINNLSEQDETGYVVSCPVFKGCYSQGDTIVEALKNIKEAIELCIDDKENLLNDAGLTLEDFTRLL